MSIQQPLKQPLIWSSLGAALLLLGSSATQADPFSGFPGSRAQGMAGAVTALADGASVWYNPAATAFAAEGPRLDLYQSSKMHPVDDSLGRDLALLVGTQHTLDAWTVGIYYFSPYTMKLGVRSSDAEGSIQGDLRVHYQTISVPLAISAGNGRLKLGITLDWNAFSLGGSSLRASRLSDNPKDPGSAILIEPDTLGGFSFSLSMLSTLYQHEPGQLIWRLGAVYRSKATDDARNKPELDEESASAQLEAEALHAMTRRVLFGKPSSAALGTALTWGLEHGKHWIFSLQLDHTRWSSEHHYNKLAFGTEFNQPLKGIYALTFAYRFGFFYSTADNNDTHADWPDMQGISLGLGVNSQQQYQFDVGLQYRHLEHRDRDDSSALYLSLGARRSW